MQGVRSLAWKALGSGATRDRLQAITWDCAPRCDKPYERVYAAGPRSRKRGKGPLSGVDKTEHFLAVTVKTPCRRCESCLGHRRALWSARARSEIAGSCETLFGTLTVKPELQHEWLLRCRSDALEDGVDFDQLTSETQFARRVRYAGKELGDYIKRLRKVLPCPPKIVPSGEPIGNWRYLLVCEAHESGAPHFHMLWHCVFPGYLVPSQRGFVFRAADQEPIGYDSWPILEDQWSKVGIARWRRVVDPEQGTYLAKYLSKDSRTRVRASENYGSFQYPVGAPTFVDIADALRNGHGNVGMRAQARDSVNTNPPSKKCRPEEVQPELNNSEM